LDFIVFQVRKENIPDGPVDEMKWLLMVSCEHLAIQQFEYPGGHSVQYVLPYLTRSFTFF
jgi:hypothetical protein